MNNILTPSFNKKLIEKNGKINSLNQVYKDDENYSKNSILIFHFIRGLFHDFKYFKKEIVNVPDERYIKNVANLILNKLPLPELKLYHEYDYSDGREIYSNCVSKEDKKLLIALACLYRPDIVLDKSNILINLPIKDIHFKFQDSLIQDKKRRTINRLKGGSDGERFDAQELGRMCSIIESAEIEVLLFKEKEYAEKFLSYSLL